MKKTMWILAMIPVAVTAVILQFLPDTIPMHHDMAGNTNRWGNKAESLIFPLIILIVALFWHLMIRAFEKKAANAKTEKEQMEAKSSAKMLGFVGISQTLMFGILHYFILYSSYVQATAGNTKSVIDIAKVSCILCGIMFVVIGNFMSKAKRNTLVGLRTTWSLYNDNTWRKSNLFAAILIIIAGLLTIVTTVFANGNLSTVFMLVYILIAALISIAYSKKVYDRETASGN